MSKLAFYSAILLIVGVIFGLAAAMFTSGPVGSGISAGDTAWVLAAAALVMIMTPGVGLFYGGMVRSKNVISIIEESVVILALVSVQWVVLGYSLAFGQDIGGFIGGLNYFMLNGVGFAPNAAYAATIPQLAYMIFQAMFAIITPALIIGAFVERVKLRTLAVFTLLWATLIYDPIAHWVWGAGGWLHVLGALDFAGGTVVHISAGFSAFAAAMIIGRRSDVKPGQTVRADNVVLVILGAALLWFGWFGFNAGSALGATGLAANAFVVTNTAAAAAALVWTVLGWAQNKKPSAIGTATGAVCGLVAITPASGFVGPAAAIAIGIIAGVVTYLIVSYRSSKVSVDDSLDVWAAHGMGGLTGALLTGVFASVAVNPAGANGLLFGNAAQLWIQLIAVLAAAAYAFVGTYIIVKVLDSTMGFRVSKSREKKGLDSALND